MPSTENSALAACGPEKQGDPRSNKRGQQWCDHYKKLYYTKDNC